MDSLAKMSDNSRRRTVRTVLCTTISNHFKCHDDSAQIECLLGDFDGGQMMVRLREPQLELISVFELIQPQSPQENNTIEHRS